MYRSKFAGLKIVTNRQGCRNTNRNTRLDLNGDLSQKIGFKRSIRYRFPAITMTTQRRISVRSRCPANPIKNDIVDPLPFGSSQSIMSLTQAVKGKVESEIIEICDSSDKGTFGDYLKRRRTDVEYQRTCGCGKRWVINAIVDECTGC